MADATNTPAQVEGEEQFAEETLSERFSDWVRTELVWYAGSFTVHLLALSLLLLVGFSSHDDLGDIPVLESKAPDADKKEPEKFEKYDMGDIEETPPPQLDVDPTLEKPKTEAHDEEYYDESKVFEHRGGGSKTGSADNPGGGASVLAFGSGPKVNGATGIGTGIGDGKNFGKGGAGEGFGGRGSGHRKKQLASGGGTKQTERAVTAALIWLANHQNYTEGNWSLQNYTAQCKDKTCTGVGDVPGCDAGATAMGLLPFLAAGQTHKSKGPYKEHITKGIAWLLRNQAADGNLAKGAHQMMYSHGLAAIALSEAYGLSGDKQVGQAAQRAIDFILTAQNKTDGGWRYNPGDAGDTSVVGWQLMALKSAHMAGLSFSPGVFQQTSKWLDSVAVHDGTEYSYQPGGMALPPMTAVGLLCRQYLGAKRDSPMLTGGVDYLMKNLPDPNQKNVYYWYYATQVLRNMNNYEWDNWNRKMRKLLVESQSREENCSKGSWDPANDAWGRHGGRLMQTSLSCLTLEIYYRYLPLFKAEAEAGGGGGAAGGADAGKQPKKAVEGK
jgi:hypothetical protein